MSGRAAWQSAAVALTDVHRSFREGTTLRRVLTGANLSVASGERVALLGRSGSGKSTVLNLISGIDLPEQGAVHVAGERVDALGEHRRTLLRRRRIGFIFQFFNLVPTLTVAENLELPLALNGVAGREVNRRVTAMLEAVGLADRAASYPDTLSGGEQQRVAVARALIHEPQVLLADEPTGNLDADTGARILELIDGLARRGGHSVVTVTHSPEVAGWADRMLHLDQGQLVAAGPGAPSPNTNA